MEVELRFFATFREAVGQKTLTWHVSDDSARIGNILKAVVERYPDLDLFNAEQELNEYLSILKNGSDIIYLDGNDTVIHDGDTVSIFPPVEGGATNVASR